MRKSLFSRLLLCYLLAAVSIFVLLNSYGLNRLEHRAIKAKTERLQKTAKTISNEYMDSFYGEKLTLSSLTLQLKSVDAFLGTRVWIVDSTGLVFADTRGTNTSLIRIKELDPTFLEKTVSKHTNFKHIFSEPMLSVIEPIFYDFEIKGYVVIHTSLRGISDDTIYYLDVINISFLIFLPLMLLLFAYIYYITALPMKRLIKAASEYSSGNYDYVLNRKGTNEYRDLSDAINYMSGELSSLDTYQKKFVANISHDFRSPLTSIKGYAEAILDGTIPHEMQDKYLGIILFETERLNKLTSGLLTLNSYENNGAILDIVSFDINHIIKRTSESFEGVCREKKITLNLVFSSKETYVEADVGKIQQVLYNLIDNAIKFSQSNSKIKVSSEAKGDKVFVAVKDYGVGIPKDSIKKVWDRFYKTDSSRGKDKKGTGLGLSITKEIIQAHNENINVISTEGVGTEFIFSLQKSEE